MKSFTILLVLSTSLLMIAQEEDSIPLSVGLKLSRTLEIQNIQKVAVSNGRVLVARAVSSNSLLLTGLAAGHSSLTVWTGKGTQSYLVTVVSNMPSRSKGPLLRDAVVKVDLEFLELKESFGSNTGVRWPEMIQFSGLSTLQGDLNTSGLNFEVGFRTAKGWLQHIVQEGWAKVLSNPEIYVRLGEEALFHSGGEFPMASSSESYGKSHRHIEWKKFGLTAKVKPESGDRIHINADVDLEVSEPSQNLSTEGVPSLTRRHLQTKINSLDGETIILSGLIRKTVSVQTDGIPVLSSIPLLGALFRSHSEGEEESELLMAVTFSLSTKADELEKRQGFIKKFDSKGTR